MALGKACGILLRRIDRYIIALLATVALATVLPASGVAADVLGTATKAAVGLLFFLYGAKLSRQAAFAGLRHWRLHLPILCMTFIAFPLFGTALRLLPDTVIAPELATGLMFLCVLPSTVQSAVAFTSMARGNVAAAICASSFSSLIGVFVTPLLAALLVGGSGGVHVSGGQMLSVVLQLLLPFLLGQLARPWVADAVGRHRRMTVVCDRGSILLVVYAAFSEGVNAGIWHRISVWSLVLLLATTLSVLAVALSLTARLTRLLRLGREDRVTAVFCASTKSLAGGLPIATVLFAGADIGLLVLPLMLYHTAQLVACAAIARRWSGGAASGDAAPTASAPASTAAA